MASISVNPCSPVRVCLARYRHRCLLDAYSTSSWRTRPPGLTRMTRVSCVYESRTVTSQSTPSLNEGGCPDRPGGVDRGDGAVGPKQQGVALARIEIHILGQLNGQPVRRLDARARIRIGDIGGRDRRLPVRDRGPQLEHSRIRGIDTAIPIPRHGIRVKARVLIFARRRVVEIQNHATRGVELDRLGTRSLDLGDHVLSGPRYLVVPYKVEAHRDRSSRENDDDRHDHQKLDERETPSSDGEGSHAFLLLLLLTWPGRRSLSQSGAALPTGPTGANPQRPQMPLV